MAMLMRGRRTDDEPVPAWAYATPDIALTRFTPGGTDRVAALWRDAPTAAVHAWRNEITDDLRRLRGASRHEDEVVIDLRDGATQSVVGRCVNDGFDLARSVCTRCREPFCEECLIWPFGPEREPVCVSCALVAAGVRTKTRARRIARR